MSRCRQVLPGRCMFVGCSCIVHVMVSGGKIHSNLRALANAQDRPGVKDQQRSISYCASETAGAWLPGPEEGAFGGCMHVMPCLWARGAACKLFDMKAADTKDARLLRQWCESVPARHTRSKGCLSLEVKWCAVPIAARGSMDRED